MRPSALHRNQIRPISKNISNLVGETKWITVFLNGDEHFVGLKFVISNKNTKSFSAFLNNLSEKLQPNFGAVRNIYDIQTGRKVLSLNELEQAKKYAAAGIEALRRCEKWFQEPVQQQNQARVLRHNTKPILPHVTKQIFPPSLRSKNFSNKSSNEPIIIYVYRNGEAKSEPTLFTLTKQSLIFWDRVLQNISQKVLPETTYIRNGFRLCALNGHVLNGADELSNHLTYVAVGNFETFRRRVYAPVENPVKIAPKPLPIAVSRSQPKTEPAFSQKYKDDFEEYDEEDEDDEAEEEEKEVDYSNEKFEDEDEKVDYSNEKFEEDEEENVQEDRVEEIKIIEKKSSAISRRAIRSPAFLDNSAHPIDNEDEGFHSGPCSSNHEEYEQTHPPILPEFLKTTTGRTLSPDMTDLETIRHSYMGFYDSPLPSYNATSKAVVAVGSGYRRPSYYYSAATQTFRRSSMTGETQSEIDQKLRLEADPNNVFHAKGENVMTRHAPEIQETKDTLVDLPVDFWEAHEVLEEIPEDQPLEFEDQNEKGNKFRSSTFAY